MSEPSKAAVEFATRIYAEMFGHVSTDPADVNRMVVLAIAFDATARASRDAVLAERALCIADADAVIKAYAGNAGASAVKKAIIARGTK